jgi:hypothetical protein
MSIGAAAINTRVPALASAWQLSQFVQQHRQLPRLGILSATDSPLRSVRCIDIGSAVDTARSLDSGTVFTTSGTNRIDRLADELAPCAASLRFRTEK